MTFFASYLQTRSIVARMAKAEAQADVDFDELSEIIRKGRVSRSGALSSKCGCPPTLTRTVTSGFTLGDAMGAVQCGLARCQHWVPFACAGS